MAEFAEVRHAPLKRGMIGDAEWYWYDPEQLEGIDDIDLLLVDGPPGMIQKNSRWPALPLLFDRLKPEDRAIQRCESCVYRIAAKDQAAPGEPRPVSVADFEAIKKDIQRRKAIELEMAQQAAEQERLKKEAAEAFKKAGVE